MLASIKTKNNSFTVDLTKPIDISMPLSDRPDNVNAFFVPALKLKPFKSGNFIGDVNQGGSCNVNSIEFNPHGNGTHTETVGHISKEKFTINNCLKTFFFEAQLISIIPEEIDNDKIIKRYQIENILKGKCPEALIIRTLPNTPDKLSAQYSGTNPPYVESAAALYLKELSVIHLLLDLPSIDKEDDGGKLLAHHSFWNYPEAPRNQCTITELIYVPENVSDGNYLLNLQIASFENDASPSKPVLYKIL